MTHPDRVCSSAHELNLEETKQTTKEAKHCFDRNSVGHNPLMGLILFPLPCPREEEKVDFKVGKQQENQTVQLQIREHFGLSASHVAWPPPLLLISVLNAEALASVSPSSSFLCRKWWSRQGTNSSDQFRELHASMNKSCSCSLSYLYP